IENKSSCNLSSATIRNILPKRTKFRRSDPIPTLVQKNPAPAGTELSWSNAKFAPGEVLLIDVGMYIRGNSGRIGLNRVCVVHPSLLAGITCKNFKIEIIP
ncbi:MAG TPA: hypothetical protein DCS07_06775, partial [Bdellovibrionales bacterium]|nr:hypothetical protein [Bdellovibrionales bacterium]